MMYSANELQSLAQLTPPVLTAYVDTKPRQRSSRGDALAYMPWLKKEAKILTNAENIRPEDLGIFGVQVARVEEFLRDRTPREKGLLILAGSGTWELVPLERQVENELHWGRPALSQLFWILSEGKPHCIVVVDRTGARFFRHSLGEMAQSGKMEFTINISQWKKKEMGHVTGQNVKKTRGSQRDTHRHRMDAQYARLCRDVEQQAKSLCEKSRCTAIFLVGSDRLTKAIEAEFPKQFGRPVVTIEEDFGKFSPSDLQKRLEPRIADWENRRQLALVHALLGDERKAVIGLDETLVLFQKGKIRSLVVAHNLNESLHQCSECGWMDRSGDPVCPQCGRERFVVHLRDVLPEMVWKTQTDVEVVAGEAAMKLNESGGIGGWLRGRTRVELR